MFPFLAHLEMIFYVILKFLLSHERTRAFGSIESKTLLLSLQFTES